MAEAVQAPVLSDETAKAGAPPPARIFVALKLAPALAEALAVLAAPLKRFGVNPIAPADIHLTLVPPWNEAAIPDAIDKLRQAAARCVPFTLAIDQIAYGPERRWPRWPRSDVCGWARGWRAGATPAAARPAWARAFRTPAGAGCGSWPRCRG
jgi:2'-5' RNA ligase